MSTMHDPVEPCTTIDAEPRSRFAGRPLAGLCRALFADARFASLKVRRRRRRLAVAFTAVLGGFPLVGWLTGELWPVMVWMIPYLAGAVVLSVATQGLLDRPRSALDERQLETRRSIFPEPYFTGAGLGLAGGLLAATATTAPEGVMAGTFMAVVGLVFGLPSIVLAWSLPDEVDDEA